MKILNQPAQHLSNYEVLTHFVSLKKDTDALRIDRANHVLRDKIEMREVYPLVKEREETPDGSELPVLSGAVKRREDVADRRGYSEELGWIQDEVIKYLCSDHVPTARQTADGVSEMANQLQDHGLTKGEVLQIVNLAPSLPVELYAIIEDVDSRFHPDPTTRLEQIADHVQATLLPNAAEEFEPFVTRIEREAANGSDRHLDVGSGDMTPAFEDKVGRWNAGQVDEADEEEMMMMQDEFITEAEYGADKEAGVDDDERNVDLQ